MEKLLIATTNPGKIKECQSILKNTGYQLITLNQVLKESDYLPSHKEIGDSFEENAFIKAKYYAQKTNLLTLADDSGLSVNALNGQPGVHSQRYGPNQTARNQRLLLEMEGISPVNRSAKFVSAIVVYNPATGKPYTSFGEVHGYITTKAMGSHGFGYDPIFFSTELNKTFGQASRAEKNSVSHRGLALEKAVPILKMLL